MAKIQLKRAQPHVDMTPMVDLFALLLTFFMLTASFRPQEAKIIDSPSSVAEKATPDNDVISVLVSNDDKVFFSMDNGKDTAAHFRNQLIAKINDLYHLGLTEKEMIKFGQGSSFGMPMKKLKAYLSEEDAGKKEAMQIGIPMDTVGTQYPELDIWVAYARELNPTAEVAINGDAEANYTIVKKVMDVMQKGGVNRFNLVTNLRKDEATLDDLK